MCNLEGAAVGRNCIISRNIFIKNNAIICDKKTVKQSVQIWNGITLENDLMIGQKRYFYERYISKIKEKKL